jgi:hypothetical protein
MPRVAVFSDCFETRVYWCGGSARRFTVPMACYSAHSLRLLLAPSKAVGGSELNGLDGRGKTAHGSYIASVAID